MKCPVDKSLMIVVEHKKIDLDYCQKCSGAWLDAGELEMLVSILKAEGASLPDSEVIASEKAEVDQKKLKCPICGHKMDKVWIGKEHKVLIDSCPSGDGLWFDKGELEKVLKNMELPGPPSSADVISFLGDTLKADYKQGAK